jgi:hypothetical protein
MLRNSHEGKLLSDPTAYTGRERQVHETKKEKVDSGQASAYKSTHHTAAASQLPAGAFACFRPAGLFMRRNWPPFHFSHSERNLASEYHPIDPSERNRAP